LSFLSGTETGWPSALLGLSDRRGVRRL